MSETTPVRLPAKAPITHQQPDTLAVFSSSDAPACIHNFDGGQLQQWQLSALAMGDEVEEGSKHVGEVIKLKYWYVHQVPVTAQDGSSVMQPRVVLISEDMEAFGFVSQGIFDYLRLLIHHMGPGPYKPALEVVATAIETKNKRTYFTLEPCPPTEDKGESK